MDVLLAKNGRLCCTYICVCICSVHSNCTSLSITQSSGVALVSEELECVVWRREGDVAHLS